MLTFLSVALLIYGSMHAYALGKVWLSVPHSLALGLGLTLAGIALTFSPLLVWFLERQSWHRATLAAAWVSYTWMGYLFLFLCIGLVFDFGHALATLLDVRWPLGVAMALRIVGLLALALLGYGSFKISSDFGCLYLGFIFASLFVPIGLSTYFICLYFLYYGMKLRGLQQLPDSIPANHSLAVG